MLDITGITALLGGVLLISVLTVAIRSVWHAHRGNIAAVLTAAGIVALAAMMWGLASAGQLGPLGTDLVHATLHL